jgi:MoaA/NifB/PqqE/SkfB family radical SAM enzyme
MRNLLSAFVTQADGVSLYDNTRRLARIVYRAPYYAKVSYSAAGRIPIPTMLRSHFPFALRDAKRPAHVTIEFTNYCNLECPYCTSPLGIRRRGMMEQRTFDILVRQIRTFRVARVRVVGNGEPTLHPRFCEMIRELGASCRYLNLVSNGQRLDQAKARAILEAPVRLLEISTDSDSKHAYERSRVRGSFEVLLENLEMLRKLKRDLKSPTLINIRTMIRPSEKEREAEIVKFWRRRADVAMPQYLHDYTRGNDADVFSHVQKQGLIPRCSLPTKAMCVHWNGRVPICELSQQQTGIPEGVIAGDIHKQCLAEIWNSPLFVQYRAGHRTRRTDLTPICRGCVGG